MKLSGKARGFLIFCVLSLTGFYFCLPSRLFDAPYSTVLLDYKNHLLGASIAGDGQWRFPEVKQVAPKFKEAIVLFEDKRFENHWGVDWLSLGRAIRQNLQAGKIVSGGSTLSMQVIRLSRKDKPRTIIEKMVEIVLATRLEFRYSKEEIISLYASHAPFGGNVVGIEAACWRYFGRSADDLSWSEAALLAVLPNNPSLIHPGRNREALMKKRNKLLERLAAKGFMDVLTLQLAKEESLPVAPLPLPQAAPHLLSWAARQHKGERITTTINNDIQERCYQILQDHHRRLSQKQIFNGAILVADVQTGHVLAYVGNTRSGNEHQENVDVIQAPRSTGSILKPFLFAAMLKDGRLLPHMLQPDMPTFINGFVPKNFSKSYDGAVPADQALIRSLNIPAVHQLRSYRYEKFYNLLKDAGLSTLNKPPDHYGLSLILGGAEGTLWDITGAYASMARTLNRYFERPGSNRYAESDFHPLYYQSKTDTIGELTDHAPLSASSIYLTFDVLKNLYRPGEETGWQQFNSAKQIAWKTGTSHGLRDGWAVGVNPDYAIGIWIGNADGEGRPGLTGTEAAAPILFDVFSSLPGENKWFQKPGSELENVEVCAKSGHRATALCDVRQWQEVTLSALQSQPCPYHKKVHLSRDGRYQVHSDCEEVHRMKEENWFVLPPIQEYYYRTKSLSYRTLPPFRSDCQNPSTVAGIDLIYPKAAARVFIPRQLDGSSSEVIFEAVCRNLSSSLYWHMDGSFIGVTKKTHKKAIFLNEGEHTLVLIDDDGEMITRRFSIISGS